MDDQQIMTICQERFALWEKELIRQHATPVLMCSVGQDHRKGSFVVSTTLDMSDDAIILFMRGALDRLTERKKGNGD